MGKKGEGDGDKEIKGKGDGMGRQGGVDGLRRGRGWDG